MCGWVEVVEVDVGVRFEVEVEVEVDVGVRVEVEVEVEVRVETSVGASFCGVVGTSLESCGGNQRSKFSQNRSVRLGRLPSDSPEMWFAAWSMIVSWDVSSSSLSSFT